MADYFGQCVVTPFIPVGDISPAERLLLTSIFSHETKDDEVYLFADIWREMNFILYHDQVREALAASPADSVAARFLTELVAKNADQGDYLEVDMDDHWMEILQDIVRRSQTLSHIAIETSYTCSRMLFDGFGGQAIVITAQAMDSMSTSQFIEDALGKMSGGTASIPAEAML
ncbi:hypothetical protein [Sphingobium sp. D43FB]|uniref:hypothetical protein n=1 Tax=Sphingobium sp. D43FB TaxID=2017595 RepID=UPI000BB558F3|nr:hypothetical protein [Sphingobium sp. D43FB]PBN43519.1 hypothetical protein SxD43FB_10380 [Sphingobium sp. D43FB]